MAIEVPSTSKTFVPPRPGDIELAYVKIVNFDQSEVQNITLLVREFNIYESIYSNHMRADLVIEDALSLITRMPIVGEEVVIIKFRTPSITPETFVYDWIDVAMRVVRLDHMSPTNIRDGLYRIQLVSVYALFNSAGNISQSYGPSTISEMVKKISKDWLAIEDSKLEVEATEGDHRFIIPRLRPFATLNFLANEAKSPTYLPSDYVFFETHKQHHFVTISSLIAKDVKEQYFVFDQSRPTDQIPGEAGSSASSVGVISAATSANRKNPADFRACATISVDKLFDIEGQLNGGMYDNATIWIDPLLQQYQMAPAHGNSHFRYLDSWNDFKHLEKGRPGHVASSGVASPMIPATGQIVKFQTGAHTRYLPTNVNQTSDYGSYPRKRQDFLSWLVSARQQNRSVKCTLTIPGDSDRLPGDVIYFELHEMGGTDDILKELNKYISGAYLVTSVRHKYTVGSALPFITVVECTKNCYETPIVNAKVTGSTIASQDQDAVTRAKELMTKMPTSLAQTAWIKI